MLCPICVDKELKNSNLREDYYFCEKCKSYFKKSEFIPKRQSKEQQVNYYYEILIKKDNGNFQEKHLNDIYNHQVNVFKDEYLGQVENENIQNKEKIIFSIAGGLPKLELLYNPTKIIVYDLIAKDFQEKEEVFKPYAKIFNPLYIAPNLRELKFIEEEFYGYKIIDYLHLNGINQQNMNKNRVIIFTFVHFFEHLNWKPIKSKLKNMKSAINSLQTKDYKDNIYFIIYQPNPETVNDNPNQLHFESAIDHISLIPRKTLEKQLEKMGYKIIDSKTTGLDLFIVCRA